ncbi:MAG: DUF2065 domain-containing protein [Burkholderiales bacterium]|jgi:hypothetical protein|nr:DUF2065 domain-containing protein [Burkholderiales bacterium]
MAANLLAALGLMLIVEGLMPMVSPPGWREAMRRIASLRDGQIRFMGLAAVLAGVALLAIAA